MERNAPDCFIKLEPQSPIAYSQQCICRLSELLVCWQGETTCGERRGEEQLAMQRHPNTPGAAEQGKGKGSFNKDVDKKKDVKSLVIPYVSERKEQASSWAKRIHAYVLVSVQSAGHENCQSVGKVRQLMDGRREDKRASGWVQIKDRQESTTADRISGWLTPAMEEGKYVQMRKCSWS
ncbi:hypothetical protein Ancab_028036 [Ancistrocladus abbreviatus]